MDNEEKKPLDGLEPLLQMPIIVLCVLFILIVYPIGKIAKKDMKV